MRPGTTARRTTATLLGLMALTAGACVAPAAATSDHRPAALPRVAPASDPVGIAGRTTSTALCQGGGSVTVTTRPAEAAGRVVVRTRATGVAPGSRWRGEIVVGRAAPVEVGPVVARGGSWSAVRTVDARRVQAVVVAFFTARRGFCSVSVKRRSPVGTAAVCPGYDTAISIFGRAADPRTTRVSLQLSSDAAPRSRWSVQLGYTTGDEAGLTTGLPETLGGDHGIQDDVDVRLHGESSVTGTAVGRLGGEVVARCRISLAGRFTR